MLSTQRSYHAPVTQADGESQQFQLITARERCMWQTCLPRRIQEVCLILLIQRYEGDRFHAEPRSCVYPPCAILFLVEDESCGAQDGLVGNGRGYQSKSSLATRVLLTYEVLLERASENVIRSLRQGTIVYCFDERPCVARQNDLRTAREEYRIRFAENELIVNQGVGSRDGITIRARCNGDYESRVPVLDRPDRPMMPMQTSRSLQKEINWGKVCEHYVEVEIQALFEHLRTYDNTLRRP
jgi:hypothetical protein